MRAMWLRSLTLVFLVALSLLPSPLHAQSTATLQGTVTDSDGALLPGATISIVNTATGITRTVTTDSSGAYLAAALPPGHYRVETSLSGFQTLVQEFDLDVARTVLGNAQLRVGGITEQVSVTGSTPVIETATISVGQTVSQRTVQEIPLNGRHFVDLGLLIPGSVTPPQNGFLTAPLRGQGSFAFNTAGNREDTVNFMVNGINLNDMAQNQITFQPSINTVSEFRVDNSTFSAEYGRNSGAIVNIATRSGSNDYHGEFFEFFRDDSLDSRNYFNQPPNPKSSFTRNQFGASTGGPIFRNRTFFFGSYEGLRQRQGIDLNSGILSDAQRDAVTDPVSRNLLALIPHANGTSAAGEPRFFGSATAPVDIDQGTGDVHHNLGSSDALHGYYAFQRDERGEPVLQANTISGFGDTRKSTRQIGTFNTTHIFSGSLVNEARFGFNRIHITFTPNALLNPLDYGINVGVTEAIGIPQITVGGIALNFGGPQNFPQGRTDTTFVLADSVSYLRGAHALKAGGEWRRFRNTNFTTDPGIFQFPSLAAFQSGVGNQFQITLGDRPSDIIQRALGLFVQDTYRATPNFTFELGLRYDTNFAPLDTENRFVLFDAETASLVRVGEAGGPDSVYETTSDLQPRLGVIWDPTGNGKMVVRSAYAIMVDQPVTNAVSPLASNPPLATPLTFSGNIRLDSAVTTAGAAGVAPTSISPDFTSGRLQTWNVNVERQLSPNFGVMVGYFGSKGDRLRIARNVNQFVNGVRPYPTLSPSSPILPNTPVGNITEVTSLGESHYNGLWLTANQRLFRGLQFNASYTLSKSTDFNSLSNSVVTVQNSLDLKDSEGPSDFDARHRVVFSTIYDLPFSKNMFVRGWQLSAIVQAQSGNPLNVVTNITTFTGVNNSLRPDLIGDPKILGGTDPWFARSVCDPRIAGSCTSDSVFALPVSADGVFHFGNLPRNLIIGPGFGNTDFSVIKNIAMSGQSRIQFRLEIFNLFNQVNLGQPNRVAIVNGTAFGTITNTRVPTGDSGSARQVQLAAKFLF